MPKSRVSNSNLNVKSDAPRERPIPFSAPMVRALLEGRKTQTRWIVKPQPDGIPVPLARWARGLADACGVSPTREEILAKAERLKGLVFPFERPNSETLFSPSCPYGKPGDRLWVKETWSPDHAAFYPNFPIVFRAENYPSETDIESGKMFSPEAKAHFPFRWRPSIHMPRRFSRLTLEITDVRVQRVEEISEADAKAEGVGFDAVPEPYLTHREAFLALFYDINKRAKRGENPWVWAVTFKRTT